MLHAQHTSCNRIESHRSPSKHLLLFIHLHCHNSSYLPLPPPSINIPPRPQPNPASTRTFPPPKLKKTILTSLLHPPFRSLLLPNSTDIFLLVLRQQQLIAPSALATPLLPSIRRSRRRLRYREPRPTVIPLHIRLQVDFELAGAGVRAASYACEGGETAAGAELLWCRISAIVVTLRP